MACAKGASTSNSAVCLDSLSVCYLSAKRPTLIPRCISACYLVNKALLCLLKRSTVSPFPITISNEVLYLIMSYALYLHNIATLGDNLGKDAINLDILLVAPEITSRDIWQLNVSSDICNTATEVEATAYGWVESLGDARHATEVEVTAYGWVESLGDARHATEVEVTAYLLLACRLCL